MKSYSEIIEEFENQQYQSLQIKPDWAQGRAVFGGLVAALMFKSCKHAVNDAERKVRNVQITFVGPIVTDEDASFQTQVLRAGGSTTLVECKVVQNGQVQSTMVASFGKSRDSVHQLAAGVVRPNYAAPAELNLFPYIPGKIPEFVQHFNMAWAEGGFPFSNIQENVMGGLCQFKNLNMPADEAEVLALIDCWPPVALQMLDKPAAASTLNWSVQFVQDMPPLSTKEWFQYQATIQQGGGGYSHAQAHFWSEQGQLLAISTQTATIFA